MKNKPILICGAILLVAFGVTIGLALRRPASPPPEPTPLPQETVAAIAEAAAHGQLVLAFSETEAFHTGDRSVDIVASIPGAHIYYTLDGSWPTTDSTRFTQPIRLSSRGGVNNAYVVRAIAVYNGQTSETVTQTFFLHNNINTRFNTLVFSISTDPYNLFDHYHGIFVPGAVREQFIRDNPDHYVIPPDPANFNLRGHEAERPIYMEVFDPRGERVFTQAAGLRTHGGWSRAAENQKSMRIIARDEYSPGFGQFHFDFFPWDFAHDGTEIDRYDTLILRNGGNGRDHDLLRHELASVLARNGGFTAVSPVRPAAVFLNGEYYGFAWLQVRFNEQYMERLFNTPTRNFDIVGMGEWWFDTDDYRIRQDLYHKNGFGYRNLLDDDVFAELEAILDIENMMWYYAFQIFMGNNDWPHNNLRRWRYTGPELGLTPETDGRWRYIMFDLDWTLGLYGGPYTKDTFYRVIASDEPSSRLLQNILTRTDMQDKFYEIMYEIASYVVTEETVNRALDNLLGQALNEITHAVNAGRYADWFGLGFMEYNHRQMVTFARYRYRQIFADMNAFFTP